MNGSDEKFPRREANSSSLQWLIAGRCGAALLLFLAGTLLSYKSFDGFERQLMRGTFSIVFAVFALSVVYLLWVHLLPSQTRWQAGVQAFVDVLLVTWLVRATGDLASPYAPLYIVIITITGIFLGSRGALVASVGCAACYTFMMIVVVLALPPNGAGELGAPPIGKFIETIGFNDAAFLIVGLLAARLAMRQSRSDVELIEATHALTNLRALHERIVESIRSGLVTIDLQGRIYTFNAAAEEITGYRAADMRGQHISILLGPVTDKIERAISDPTDARTSARYEADCLTADGLRIRLGFGIAPLFDESGKTTGLVITFQDLTQVRALEDASRRQDRLAAVGRVAAGIAHEIRNPLASMRGSIQVLQSEMHERPAQAELMEIILRESDRLNHIITDFLTYARPPARTLTEVDVREPLRETFTLLRHSPELRDGHTLDEKLPERPVVALVDAAGLRQVFWNLSRNALHAMPKGGRLLAEVERAEQERVRITFTDTGDGMTPEQVERLFEPFSSSTNGGTGLGLSIVYQIIRDHNGTINVRSREGHGTTITIEIPGRSQESEVRMENNALAKTFRDL
ncbi:MAG: PAS domain S-box protein [Pyrinomonadaceae bacterium]|nr:PAS domain S-box protein [Pyrinomonadaceae bacterium]